MTVLFHENPGNVNWGQLREDLTDDEFHNGRTTHQLKLSFENSQLQAYANDQERCIGTARALSDGAGNACIIREGSIIISETGNRNRDDGNDDEKMSRATHLSADR